MNKINKRFLSGAAAAALSASLATVAYAQTVPGTSRGVDRDPATTTLPADSTRLPSTSSDAQTTVSKVNKASSLIGMDVRNQQNEKLGEIKDLVLDLQSGKISYAVLSVGGFLGIGDKYVAVPPNAFTLAPEHDRVVLNADKAKIQNSPGFAKNSWPDVNSSSWTSDASYWLDAAAAGTAGALGTAGSVRSGTGLGSDASRVQSGTSTSTDLRPLENANRTLDNANRPLDNANRALDNAAASTRSTVDRATAGIDERNAFRGRITAINPETRTMTVEGPAGTREFKFTEKPTITLKDNRNPRLSDLHVGFPVTVGFHEENGTYTAHSVIRSDAPEVR